ncbi:unnamed protein product [Ambrosiozyma monospora]|uniref:Unnamed protein product n=1 Tax=Ambrosiozyma monospora TaxID=43982 RepID=A0A9W6YVK3_AMBMO|nr:unnamed protein product [Ambrosiozyma monospora]
MAQYGRSATGYWLPLTALLSRPQLSNRNYTAHEKKFEKNYRAQLSVFRFRESPILNEMNDTVILDNHSSAVSHSKIPSISNLFQVLLIPVTTPAEEERLSSSSVLPCILFPYSPTPNNGRLTP